MRSIRTLATALLLATALSPAAALAQDQRPREPVIVVSGEGDAAVAPDLAIVSLGVTETRKTAREALDVTNAAMTAVIDALRKEGIAPRDLQTSGLSIQAQYSYPQNEDGTPRPPVLTGYMVSNTLTARVRDLTRVGAVIDAAVTLGVNQGGDIRFTNDDPAQTVTKARGAAVRNAIDKARTLADAAGVKLGRILEITEAGTPDMPRPMMSARMAKESADAVPVEAGENSYAVNVNVTFAIDP
ncbi:MAG: SIMPL domain-containing protein [Rhizobium sp.]|nr:SIMPL domain-containing protein [Rhizobium sp.]